MSHDQSRRGYHGRNHNSETPLTNGMGSEVIPKLHTAQFMDGSGRSETGSTHPIPHSNSVPRKMHHHIHENGDDITDNYDSGSHARGQTTSIIGPSASIPEYLGTARQSRFDMYLEEADGAGMSRRYDVTADESGRRKKPPAQQPHNVKLLNYKPFSGESGERELGDEAERREGDTNMTLSQQDFVSDLDAKITKMIRTKKVSEGGGRAPRIAAAPLTKESMKEVMNMTPKREKKSSRAEVKRRARNTVHGVPWEVDKSPEKFLEEGASEMDTEMKKKLEKKRKKLVKTESVQLVGYRRSDDLDETPSHSPARGAEGGIRESGSQIFSSRPVGMPTNSSPFRVKGSMSTSSSFEFQSAFSPTHPSTTHQRSLSPTQELVDQIMSKPVKPVSVGQSSSIVRDSELENEREGPPKMTSMFDQEEGRTVYRQNLADTHLSDVAVFGKHFDPSQLTQERMEANVGDLSSVGLRSTSVSPSKKKGETRAKKDEFGEHNLAVSTSVSSRQKKGGAWNSRSKSASVSPNRKKGEKEHVWKMGKSSVKSHDSSESEGGKLSSWELEISPHDSRHSAVLSTPSRYRMGRVARTLHEPGQGDDVFLDELGDENMPNIYGTNPRKSLLSGREASGRGVKEGTPDSGASDEEKPKKRRSIGFAFGRKLSTSMKEIFATKEKKNPTSGTTWHFETGELYPAPSEPQLSILTEEERRALLEETEVVPRTHSTEVLFSSHSSRGGTTSSVSSRSGQNPLAHLFVPLAAATSSSNPGLQTDPQTGFYAERSVDGYTERSVDIPSSQQRHKSASSGDDYETASESEEGYVKSAVNIITSPSNSTEALREAGYFVEEDRQTGQTGLPTIDERTPPANDVLQYQIPPPEDAPIVKSLHGVIDKKAVKDRSDGKVAKKTKATSSRGKEPGSKKQDTKKENKPMFSRFSKQRTIVQRRTPSPRSVSPSSGSISSGSRQSSGRFSPAQKPTNASSTTSSAVTKHQPTNVDSNRRPSKSSVGSSSPSGSFRGGQISPLAHSGLGSPRGSFRGGGASSPRSSGRGSTTLSGLNVARGRGTTSPKPGGLNSPRGSFKSGSVLLGSPGGSMRGQKSAASGGRGSPVVKTTSPRSSVQLRHPLQSSGRQSPTVKAGISKVKKRRLSEPGGSDIAEQSPGFKRGSVYTSSVTNRPTPVPVRHAPPPPSEPQQKTLPVSLALSRTSSQTSTITPPSNNSSTSSPRQRKRGMSFKQSPLTPRSDRLRVPEVFMEASSKEVKAGEVPGEEVKVGEASAKEVNTKEAGATEVKTEEDAIDKLLASVGKKIAALSPSPEPNPIDAQMQFEIPPPPDDSTVSPPPGGEEKVPSYSLSASGELLVEGKPPALPEGIILTPEDSPEPVRRGMRPKNVISALMSGRKRSSTTTTKPRGTSKAAATTSTGSLRKGKASDATSSSAVRTSGRKASLAALSVPNVAAVSSKSGSQKTGTGSVQRAPSLRGSRNGEIGDGRSKSAIAVPTIKVSEARKSMRKVSASNAIGSSAGGLRSARSGSMGSQASIVRSSIRVSSKLKKNHPMSPEHRKANSLSRTRAGDRPPSRGSVHTLPRHSTTARPATRRPARVAPVAPGRSSVRKISTGAETLNRNQQNLLNSPDRRRQSVMSKSMRKTSTLLHPQTQGLPGNSLNRNVGTRSLRMSSSRKVSTLGTMPRTSVISRVSSPPVSTGNLQMTPTRKSMRKPSRDVYAVFDQISADAKGNL